MYIYIYPYIYIHILMDIDIDTDIHMLPHRLKTSLIDKRPSNVSKAFPNPEAYVSSFASHGQYLFLLEPGHACHLFIGP